MDWPTRTLWSRIAWLRVRMHYFWRARRRRGSGSARRGEPAWWTEFEQAFWSHIHSQPPTAEGRRPGPRTQPRPPECDA